MVSLNSNIAQQNNFQFTISADDNKNIMLNVTELSGLGMSISPIELPFHSNESRYPSNTIRYNEMSLTVILDDKFEALEQIYTYMNTIKDTGVNMGEDDHYFRGLLRLFDGMYYPLIEYTFHNCWISNMGDINFSTSITDTTPISLAITVQYDYFSFERV